MSPRRPELGAEIGAVKPDDCSLARPVVDRRLEARARPHGDVVDRHYFAARRLELLGEEIERDYDRLRLSPDLVELRNITLVGSLIVACAQRRLESRGLHYNLDHPRRKAALGRLATSLRRERGKGRRLVPGSPASL